ncbi:MAG: protein kinase [Acidobacteriota bacterium]
MDKIGKYQLLEQIGVGGFGEVFRGFDPFIKRNVAIKTCSSQSTEIRSRFFQEAEIAGNLNHRNITTVYDFGVEGDLPFLIQEYLSGEDLDRKIKRREFLPYPEKVFYLLQIARGLACAHDEGVIHRDIKPANIRILDDGTAKIMDFGIAKLAQAESGLTQTGMTVGTAAYLAPEQVRGATVDLRTDIFSFGVLAYELLTYERPFQGQQISSVLYQVLHAEPKPILELWPSAPPDIVAIIDRCLSKDPSGRFADGSELMRRLEVLQRQGREDRAADAETPAAGLRRTSPPPAPPPNPGGAGVGGSAHATTPLPSNPDGRPSDRGPSGGGGSGASRTSMLEDVELSSGQLEPPSGASRTIPADGYAASTGPSSSRTWVALLVVALAAVAGLGGWWIGNRGSVDGATGGGSASVAGETAAADTSAVADTESAPGAGGAAADSVDADGPAAPEGGPADAPEPAARTEGEAPGDGETQAPSAEPSQASLTLLRPPWTRNMQVRIGPRSYSLNRQWGLKMDPGTYTLTFSLDEDGYVQTARRTVDLTSGASVRVSPPIPQPGRLSARPLPRRPQGIVWIDGERIRSTPVRQVPLAPGTYAVEIHPRGEGDNDRRLRRDVTIEAGVETILTFDLDAEEVRVVTKSG